MVLIMKAGSHLSNNHRGTWKKQGLLLTGSVGHVAHSEVKVAGGDKGKEPGPGALPLLGSMVEARVLMVHSL